LISTEKNQSFLGTRRSKNPTGTPSTGRHSLMTTKKPKPKSNQIYFF